MKAGTVVWLGIITALVVFNLFAVGHLRQAQAEIEYTLEQHREVINIQADILEEHRQAINDMAEIEYVLEGHSNALLEHWQKINEIVEAINKMPALTD